MCCSAHSKTTRDLKIQKKRKERGIPNIRGKKKTEPKAHEAHNRTTSNTKGNIHKGGRDKLKNLIKKKKAEKKQRGKKGIGSVKANMTNEGETLKIHQKTDRKTPKSQQKGQTLTQQHKILKSYLKTQETRNQTKPNLKRIHVLNSCRYLVEQYARLLTSGPGNITAYY